MTKEEIEKVLDNFWVFFDIELPKKVDLLIDFMESLQEEHKKQKELLDIVKKVFLNDYVDTMSLTNEEYDIIHEWLEND